MNGNEFYGLPGDDDGNKRMKISMTFGELLVLIAMIVGMLFQYMQFNTRMGQFEGYTKAKFESIDASLKRLDDCIQRYSEKREQ